MAYTKQNFKDGDTLYASQLEKMEDAILANETAAANALPKSELPSAVDDAIVAAAPVSYKPQTLTDEQKAQARENIGAATVEEVVSFLEGQEATGLLGGVTWKAGYLAANATPVTAPLSLQYGEAYTEDFIGVTPGETYRLTYKFPHLKGNSTTSAWWAINQFTATGSYISRTVLPLTNFVIDGDVTIYTANITIGSTTSSIRVSGRTKEWLNSNQSAALTEEERNTKVQVSAPNIFFMTLASDEETTEIRNARLLPTVNSEDDRKLLSVNNGVWSATYRDSVYDNPNIIAINHRGYCNKAPENTLSAYRLSKKKGFKYVECDVSFTADNVAVLLHDSTVDRTSNGTGSISTLTFEQVRTLDFGSWFSEDYTGEQIPTFEEFLILCKRIGLHAYIEIKGNVSIDNAANLVALVNRYGMNKSVTWISFYQNSLANIKSVDPTARLGFVTESTSENNITIANGLKTETNTVFIDIGHYALTADFINLCAENKIPLEVWTINNADTLAGLDPYVSGYTSDNLLANEVLYDAYG